MYLYINGISAESDVTFYRCKNGTDTVMELHLVKEGSDIKLKTTGIPQDLILENQTVTTDTDFIASGTVTAKNNFVVENTATVNIKGSKITLEPGVTLDSSSTTGNKITLDPTPGEGDEGYVLATGQWHRIAFLRVPNTATGEDPANGSFKLWVGDTVVLDKSGLAHPTPQYPQVLDLGIVNQTANANVDFILDELGPESGWKVVNSQLHGTTFDTTGQGRMDFDVENRLTGVKIDVEPDLDDVSPSNTVQVSIGVGATATIVTSEDPYTTEEQTGRFRAVMEYKDTGIPTGDLTRTLKLYWVKVVNGTDIETRLLHENDGKVVPEADIGPCTLGISCTGNSVHVELTPILSDPDDEQNEQVQSIDFVVDHTRTDIVALEVIADTSATAEFDNLTWTTMGSADPVVTTYEYDKYEYATGKYRDGINRLEAIKVDGVLSVDFVYDDYDQLRTKTEYNGAGTEDDVVTTYTHDRIGRLTQIKRERYGQADEIHNYTYWDGTWYRATASATGGETTEYIYDGFNCIRQTTGDLSTESTDYTSLGTMPLWRTNTLDNDPPDPDTITTETFLTDGLGNITGYRNHQNTANVDLTDFDAFGNPLDTVGTQPHYSMVGYRGQLHDLGTGQIYLRNRYYDPQLGRFTVIDPARHGDNHYIYPADPVNMWDPTGLRVVLRGNKEERRKLKDDLKEWFQKSGIRGYKIKEEFGKIIIRAEEKRKIPKKRDREEHRMDSRVAHDGTLKGQIIAGMIQSDKREFTLAGKGKQALENWKLHVLAREKIVESARTKKFDFKADEKGEVGVVLVNEEMWEKKDRLKTKPKKDVGLRKALEDMWEERTGPTPYAFACRPGTGIIMLRGIAVAVDTKGEDAFDKYAKDVKLPFRRSNVRKILKSKPHSTIHDDDWIPGDWGYIDNPKVNKGATAGENVIYMGDGKFFGHLDLPPWILTTKEWFGIVKEWNGKAEWGDDRDWPALGLE